MSSLTTVESAAAWRDELDTRGEKLVFTNGCFDLLHVGHVRYLKEARALGDALVVGMNSDDSVRTLKGEGRPVNTAEDRAEILCALECVDRVVVFETPRVTGLIEAIRPHIYTKGGDYTVESLIPEERIALEEIEAEIAILSLVPGKSTSATLTKMKRSENGERKPRLAILGSGQGSNFTAICDAIGSEALGAEVAIVVSDCEGAPILRLAEERTIPQIFVNPGESKAKLSSAAQKEIVDRLQAAEVDWVILAGFMRILDAALLDEFAGRILNIHPSLLPKFPGLKAWEQALEAGETETGCTVHLVDETVDGGEILGQKRVPIKSGDTASELLTRIHEAEHTLFPEVIAKMVRK